MRYRIVLKHDALAHERKVGGKSKTFMASKEYIDDVRGNSRTEEEAAKYIASRRFGSDLDENDDSWTATIKIGQKNPKTGMYPITVTVHRKV